MITFAIAAIPQITRRRLLKLVNKEVTTVFDLNVIFVEAAITAPVITNFSCDHALIHFGMFIAQPSGSLRSTPHFINTFGWHGNPCGAVKSTPPVVHHCIFGF